LKKHGQEELIVEKRARWVGALLATLGAVLMALSGVLGSGSL
jgi:hypothetical protein